MSGVDDRNALLHRIETHMMRDIAGDHDIRTCCQRPVDVILAAAGQNRRRDDGLVRISVAAHSGHMKGVPHQRRKIPQRHVSRQCADPAQSLMRDVVLIGNLEHLPVLQLQLVRCRVRHPHDVKIRMAGIVSDIPARQFQNPPADIIRVIHLLHAVENHRMVRDQRIRVSLHSLFDHAVRRIHGEQDALHLFVRAPAEKSDIIPVKREAFRTELLNLLHQL